jgi:glycosyltransferase involved in cell wall biosynthesis
LAVRTAADLADRVVVLIGEGDAAVVAEAAADLPVKVEVVRVPIPVGDGAPVYIRYLWWLWRCARHLDRLTRREDVDVIHHVTYASDWLPAPFALAPKRSRTVWGPVGGNSYPPLAALRHLSAGPAAKDVARRVVTSSVRCLTLLLMRGRTDAALAINPDSQAFTERIAPSQVHPNAAWDELPATGPPTASPAREAGGPTALYAGRLLEWKGAVLAVRAVRAARRDWRLTVLGEGPAEDAMRAAADGDPRIEFVGRVDRAAVLERMRSTDVLMLPSLHDSGPWVAAEAAAAGLAVLCLDLGGVAEMAGKNAAVVPVAPPSTLVERLAAGLDGLADRPRRPELAWTTGSYRRAFAAAYGLAADT